jgi:beta-lactam-binding protein with PASTA domain
MREIKQSYPVSNKLVAGNIQDFIPRRGAEFAELNLNIFLRVLCASARKQFS